MRGAQMTIRRRMPFVAVIGAIVAQAIVTFTAADAASSQPATPLPPLADAKRQFNYIIGLDPKGDNWLALRSEPTTNRGIRLMKLGPETLFTLLRVQGDWSQVQLQTGEIGWV